MALGIAILLFLIGLAGLWFGAHLAIDGSLGISKELKISKLFIGLTIISIGTSLPEIFTHIVSGFNILAGINASGVAIGTNIGSNIIQITFILGLIGLLATVKSSRSIQRRDGLVMLGAIALLFFMGLNGIISRLEGFILAGLYLFYMYYLSRKEKHLEELFELNGKNVHKSFLTKKAKRKILSSSLILLLGIAVLIVAAEFVVRNAVILADAFGISQTLIGTMIIGVSTALPELTTAMIGIKRGAKNLSLGVLIGSNVTNPMLALGVGAIIAPLTMARSIEFFDLPFWFGISAVALLFFEKGHRLDKHEAALLITAYIAYAIVKFYVLG